MATRLHSEDNKGQSNWADIDDDDDDWAPETITWTDGTKITLPPPDETQNSSVGPAQAGGTAIAKDKSASDKTRSAAPSRTASPSVRSGGLASGKGLILKAGSTEKVTLVTKPSAPPPPAKSPWAPLPPIQKASPVVVDSLPLHTSPRLPLREPHAHKSFQHPAAREIAADDFSRSSWRDGPNMASRELYNSQSGRYEPVQDRRGSFRGDVYSRPALLQRPHPHHHDSTEPSPTFQASRPVQDGPFGRRRGSSNVSGGSGLLQRAGKGYDAGSMPPPDVLNTRRGSFAASTDSHISPRNFSPSGQAGARLQSSHGWPSRTSPAAAYATPHYSHAHSEKPPTPQGGPGSNVALQSEEDTVEFQKRLMRERREEAIRRRLEEEAREEAAKAERIRLKLEAMGPPPERKSAKKELTTADNADAATTTPSLAHSTVSVPGQATTTANDQNIASQEDQGTSKPATISTATTLPAGLPSELSADSQPQSKPTMQQDMGQPHIWQAPAQPSSSRLTSWPSSSQQPSRNVWGSPNNDRGLGNGTFNPDLGRVPESRATQLPQHPAKEPAPIGPPSARVLSQQPPTQAYPAARLDRYGAPEPRQYSEKQNQWVASVLQSDASLREQRARERADFDQRLAEQGLTYDDAQPTIKQSWRPDSGPSRPEQVSRVAATSWGRAVDEGSKHSNSISPDTHAPNGVISGSGAAAILTSNASAATSAQPRASRFFPPKERDTRAGTHTNSESERPKSPSPPPPTMDDHPAYDGDASHPHVSLPPPQPIVKLPPAPPTSASGQAPKADSTWLNSTHHRPLHSSSTSGSTAAHHSSITIHSPPQSQQEWQEKIYELTGRRAAPPKSPAVESASRTMLDHSSQHNPATVSLPSHIAVKEMDKGEVTSKPMADECFEEQEMGSLPLIRIPHKAPDAAWQPAVPANKPLPRTFMVVANTAKHLDLSDHSVVRISFPGMPMEVKTVTFHSSNRGSSRSTGHGRSSGRNRASGSNYRGGSGGKRDASSGFTNESTSSAQGPTSSLGSRGRGGYRTRAGETWSRRSTHSTNN